MFVISDRKIGSLKNFCIKNFINREWSNSFYRLYCHFCCFVVDRHGRQAIADDAIQILIINSGFLMKNFSSSSLVEQFQRYLFDNSDYNLKNFSSVSFIIKHEFSLLQHYFDKIFVYINHWKFYKRVQ